MYASANTGSQPYDSQPATVAIVPVGAIVVCAALRMPCFLMPSTIERQSTGGRPQSCVRFAGTSGVGGHHLRFLGSYRLPSMAGNGPRSLASSMLVLMQ